MLFRLSQKLTKKIKLGKLIAIPLGRNKVLDWSAHVFNVSRQQHILLCNTASLYSCVMPGAGVTNETQFVAAAIRTIEQFMIDDGFADVFKKNFIAPKQDFQFFKALNRSVIGSMNDLIFGAQIHLAKNIPAQEVGCRLNETPLSALIDADGRNFANPREVMEMLSQNLG